MLDNIASTSETLFRRQVSPSAEGHLRPHSRGDAEQQHKQAESVQTRQSLRAEQQELARDRLGRQLEASEASRQRSERTIQDFSPTPSRSTELAEKLAKTVRDSRDEELRQQRRAQFVHPNKSRHINQAYMANLPIQQNRIIDEMA